MLLDASQASFPGGNSNLEPPDPIPNSEVKRISADGSVGSPHVRVGHCQDLNPKKPLLHRSRGFFLAGGYEYCYILICVAKIILNR